MDAQLDADDENKAWAFYYNKCYNKEIKEATGKSDAAKKKAVDKLLQSNWLDFDLKQKKRYVNLATKSEEKSQSDQASQPQAKTNKRSKK